MSIEAQDFGSARGELRAASKNLEAEFYKIESENKILRRALELAHKAWQEEYQSVCYEGGYSTLVPANEALKPDYWIEQATKEKS